MGSTKRKKAKAPRVVRLKDVGEYTKADIKAVADALMDMDRTTGWLRNDVAEMPDGITLGEWPDGVGLLLDLRDEVADWGIGVLAE